MRTNKYVSLEVLTEELEKFVDLSVAPRNQAEERAQFALESAHMALKYGKDQEWARSKVLAALAAL